MKTSGIYKIQSILKPKRCYIGSAVDITDRWRCHLRDLRKNKHHSGKLQNHYNVYGESDLQFIVLLGCDKEDLIKTEQYFIDSYKPYFNICAIAGSRIGTKASKETRLKLSISHKGKKLPKEQCDAMSKRLKGKPRPEGFMKKLHDFNRGKKRSKETCEKISKVQQGIKKSIESNNKRSNSLKGNKNAKGNKNMEGKKQSLDSILRIKESLFLGQYIKEMEETKNKKIA